MQIRQTYPTQDGLAGAYTVDRWEADIPQEG